MIKKGVFNIGYTVVYAEKPSVGRSIASALGKQVSKGDGYIEIDYNGTRTYITWGYGHLCGLYELSDYDEDYKKWQNIDLPFIPKDYKLKTKKETYKQFKIVKDLFNNADLIINATDPDREGEVIFAYLYQCAKCKIPFKRVYFVSQNADAFREAFANLVESKDVKNLENAGRMRGIADWLVGMNLTVADTLHCNTLMSIGRVQTPTLAMVVDREKKIQNFVPEKYYVPQATFTTKNNETYKGDYVSKSKITDKSDAENIISKLTGKAIISKIDKKTKKVPTPPLYSLGTLQMEASSKFGFSAQRTLDIVQSLYEGGYVTYPRTSSAYLPADYMQNASAALNSLKKMSEYQPLLDGKKYTFNKKYFDDSKVEAHFAIVPTHVTPKNITSDQSKIYDLIARSLIITIYPEAVVESTKIITEDNGVQFSTSGNTIKTKGWMEVSPSTKETILPSILENENVQGSYNLAEKETEPPKRYTDKTLIAAMIAADKDSDNKDILSLADLNVVGIGTEATRAGIIETLVSRGYIERNKKAFAATEKGIALIDNLPIEDLKSATLTAEWETRLNNIANGKENPAKFQKDIEDKVTEWCKVIKTAQKSEDLKTISRNSTTMTCPVCQKPIVKHKWGYGCSGYKDGCKFSISGTIAGKKLTEVQVKSLVQKGKTSEIKGFTSKSGKKFSACLILDEEGKVKFDFQK